MIFLLLQHIVNVIVFKEARSDVELLIYSLYQQGFTFNYTEETLNLDSVLEELIDSLKWTLIKYFNLSLYFRCHYSTSFWTYIEKVKLTM